VQRINAQAHRIAIVRYHNVVDERVRGRGGFRSMRHRSLTTSFGRLSSLRPMELPMLVEGVEVRMHHNDGLPGPFNDQ
jgi:hypothetical protein